MALEEISVKKLTLRYDGLFDFDAMYAMITDWAKNYNYIWHEAEYKHKAAGKGAEQEFKWVLSLKVNEWVNYEITVTVHTWDILEVEVEVEGKKKAFSNARITMDFNGKLTLDRQDIFKKGSSGKLFGGWYKKLFSAETDEYYDQLYYRMQSLHALVKKYFDMQGKKHVFKGYLGEN